MSPIIDLLELTENRKDEIKYLYQQAIEDTKSSNELSQMSGYARMILLEILFDENLLKND